MKHYYFRSITDWQSQDKKENKKLLWFTYGGRKRGSLEFKFFNTNDEALSYCKELNMVMN